MKPKFEVMIDFIFDDIYALNIFYLFKKQNLKKTFAYLLLIITLLFIFSIVTDNYLFLLLVLITIPCLLQSIRTTLKKETLKYYETSKDLKEGTKTLTFYDKYFESKSEVSYYKVNYDQVYEVAETDGFFFIFISSAEAYIIRKTLLKDELKFQKFISKKTPYIYYK
jgi:hypothetical protein